MNYAGFWIRFIAYLVDSLIVTVGFVALVMLLGMMGLELFSLPLIYFVFSIFYWALMQSSKRQATIGKGLVGLKVGGPNGERLSVGRSLAREVAKILSSLTLLIGYLLAAFTKRKQALHDMIASTVVVRDAPGKVVVALAIAFLALMAPFAAAFVLGVGALSGMVPAELTALVVEPEKPKPAAPKPQPQAAAPAAPAVPSTPEPAKPGAEPAKPASEPVKVAAAPVAKEPEKPATAPKEPAKRAAKPKVSAEDLAAAPTADPAPAAPAADPAPAASDAPAVPATPRKVAAREAAPQFATAPAASDPRFNDFVTAVLYRDAKAVEDLISFGKWPDKADSSGMTPLMLAVSLGDTPIVEVLLKAGANPNRPGPAGATAFSLARERNDAAMLGLLQRYARIGP